MELTARYGLEFNPFLKNSKEILYSGREYREAVFRKMRYRAVFRTDGQTVYVLGVFHTLEDYGKKAESPL